jgi:hypothetical protein
MYEFQHERERREKIFKAYLMIFSLIATSSFIYGLWETNSLAGTIVNFIFAILIFTLALKGEVWPVYLLKFYVWMHLLSLILIAAVYLFG